MQYLFGNLFSMIINRFKYLQVYTNGYDILIFLRLICSSFDQACISKREKYKFVLLRKKFLTKFGFVKGFKLKVLNIVFILLIRRFTHDYLFWYLVSYKFKLSKKKVSIDMFIKGIMFEF